MNKTLYEVKFLNHGNHTPYDFMDKLTKALSTEFQVEHFDIYNGSYTDGMLNFELKEKDETVDKLNNFYNKNVS